MSNVRSIVLLELCRHSLDWVNSVYPISSITISNCTNIPRKDICKALKELKNMGLVHSFKRCYMGEDNNCILNGWGITDAAINTPEYEIAKQEEEKYIQSLMSTDQTPGS